MKDQLRLKEKGTCDTCTWYHSIREDKSGQCRRYAPTINGWRIVYNDEWCGEHEVNTKLKTAKREVVKT